MITIIALHFGPALQGSLVNINSTRMNNHNAILVAISSLQDKWQTATNNKDYQLIRWLIEKDDVTIFNEFLQLECTASGSLEETFIILFTPFREAHNYAYFLVKDWLEIFAKEAQDKGLPLWEDYPLLKEQWEQLSPEEHHQEENTYLLAALLQSFKKYISENKKLVFGLLPNAVANENHYSYWIENMLASLPSDVALMITDVANSEKYERLFGKEENGRITISATECYDAKNVYKQLATSGDPNDPHVAFRQCLFGMGESAKDDNKRGVHEWGEKALACTRKSGDNLLLASAHIIYAGFLFGFKSTEKIHQLLDQGMIIASTLLDNPETEMAASSLLAQLYGYKAAYLNIQKEHDQSILWFEKQADLYIRYKQESLSIGAFQNALFVASKHKKNKVSEIAEKAFPIGYAQSDESLLGSGFPVLAYHYLKVCKEEEKNDIENRMQYLYGEDWQASAKKNFAIAPEEYVL